MNYVTIEMPTINLTATKVKIDTKIKEYNEGLPLSEQIRGSHFDTLWRIVEHFTYKIMKDNKTMHPSLRRVRLDKPDRILHTSNLSRDNIKEWIRVNSVGTVTRRLQRLAKAGLISLTKRGNNNQHLTSVIALNKDIIAIEDILDPSRNNHAQMDVKTRSNELKKDLEISKNRFVENQGISPKKDRSSTPLLNTSKHNNLNNKLMESGAFFEKSKKEVLAFQNSANSANPLPRTPNQENVFERNKENERKYAEKINGKPKKNRFEVYSAQSDAENLEDYRRSMAEYVFRESLILWKHRNDVYDGDLKKAAVYVAQNFFKADYFSNMDRIDEGVDRALWCINFQLGQRKTAKMEENKEQFVFYPYKYFTAKGTGSFDGLRRYYTRYKDGYTLTAYERSLKKIKPSKKQKNYKKEIVAIRKYVAHYLEGKRNLQSLKRFEALIKKNHPNKPKYLDQFRKMISGHFVN